MRPIRTGKGKNLSYRFKPSQKTLKKKTIETINVEVVVLRVKEGAEYLGVSNVAKIIILRLTTLHNLQTTKRKTHLRLHQKPSETTSKGGDGRGNEKKKTQTGSYESHHTSTQYPAKYTLSHPYPAIISPPPLTPGDTGEKGMHSQMSQNSQISPRKIKRKQSDKIINFFNELYGQLISKIKKFGKHETILGRGGVGKSPSHLGCAIIDSKKKKRNWRITRK